MLPHSRITSKREVDIVNTGLSRIGCIGVFCVGKTLRRTTGV